MEISIKGYNNGIVVEKERKKLFEYYVKCSHFDAAIIDGLALTITYVPGSPYSYFFL